MSINTFEGLLGQLEQHVVSRQVVEFSLDAVLASGVALQTDREAAVLSIAGRSFSEADFGALLCFDVVAVASALALRSSAAQSGQGSHGGDRQTALVDLWGGAQAARTLWGDHFLFAVSPTVEGRIEAVRETARVLGGQAVSFSLQIEYSAPQFADFVAKGLQQG
jgi:hypothetical protein